MVPLVQAITSQPPADDSCLHRSYSRPAQEQFLTAVVKDLGYDFQRGRIDVTHHPFTISVSPTDVRITVRYENDFLGQALFSAIHEGGHAMYEQGIDRAYEGTPLGREARAQACTRASHACGRTSSGAAGVFGRTTIRSCVRPFPGAGLCSPGCLLPRDQQSADVP